MNESVALRTFLRRDSLESVEGLSASTLNIELDDGWVIGKPFRICRIGEVYDRDTGESRLPRPVTREDLQDAVRVFSVHSPRIDVNHREYLPQGIVGGMAVVDDGEALAIVPLYNPRLAGYVSECSGALWSSPILCFKPYYHPGTGEKVGGFWVRSVAITEDPAQWQAAALDPVSLSASKGEHYARGDSVLIQEDADLPIETQEQKPTVEKRTMNEEMKAMLAMLIERFDAIDAMLLKMSEKLESKPEDPEAESVDGEGGAEAEMAALTAENGKLRCDLLVTKLTAAGKILPSEVDTVKALFASAGGEMVERVYGTRVVNSAVTPVVGHSKRTGVRGEVDTAAERAVELQAKAKEAGRPISYTEALQRAYGE